MTHLNNNICLCCNAAPADPGDDYCDICLSDAHLDYSIPMSDMDGCNEPTGFESIDESYTPLTTEQSAQRNTYLAADIPF